MSVELAYLLFSVAAIAVFRLLAPATAALVVFLGGWLLLPVGNYPPGSADVIFPYWITGLAVPSSMLLTKAWVAPAAALLGVMLFDRPALARLQIGWIDLPVALWCLWPLLQSFTDMTPRPAGWLSSAYLMGCWALPWLLGRLYFGQPAGQLQLLKALAIATAVCLPISLIEGIVGPVMYGWIYDDHPFRFDGIDRYLGFRPMGFFENGNQFGLWVCLGALAALAVVAVSRHGARRFGDHAAIAFLALSIALAAQSVGGILLLVLGLTGFMLIRWIKPKVLLLLPVIALVLGGGIYLSGAVPVTEIGKNTALGQKVVQTFRDAGRGSFPWRIGQDQKLIGAALSRPLVGTGHWAWWRDKETRPWGLALLLVGQFGLIGFALAMGTLLWPSLLYMWRTPRTSPSSPDFVPVALAAIVCLAALDTLMNSFLYFPALVAAGGLAGRTHSTPCPRRGSDSSDSMS